MGNLIVILESVKYRLYQIGGPIFIGLGTISCILSVIVFNKPKLRKSPCSIYFIGYHTSSFLLIYTTFLAATLTHGYNTDLFIFSTFSCRFLTYMALATDAASQTYLVLASIDRVLITSRNHTTRQKSTRRLAYILLIFATLFWIFFHSPAVFLQNTIEFAPNYFICYFNPAIYLAIITYYGFIFRAFIIPFSLIFLGIWTVKNVRCVSFNRTVPSQLSTDPNRSSNLSPASKEHQLIRMLFMNIIVYLVCNSLPIIFILYEQITLNNIKDQIRTYAEYLFRFLIFFNSYIPFCISCYTNIMVSKTYRKEVKGILIILLRRSE